MSLLALVAFVAAVRLVARARPAEPPARALLVLLVAACLTGVVARRHGITHLLGFVPSERTEAQPTPRRPVTPAPAPLARDGVILLLDGLRVDAAERSAAWRALAPRGARLRARVRYPVKSAASRALLVTGAPPEVSGVLGNTPSVRGDVDHLFARAAQAGLALDLEHDWPAWLGLAPTPPSPPLAARRLTVRDWFECDHAGHAHGADSDEYRAAAAGASDRLVAAVSSLDLTRTVLLALADHGHVDRGGHLGLEPEVATAPVLLLGAGVRPGFARDEPVAMEDVGATLGVALGLEPPAAARGVPVTAALELPAVDGAALEVAAWLRRGDLEGAWPVSPRRVALGRVLFAGLLLLLALEALRPALDRALALALLGPLAATGASWLLHGVDGVSGELRWTVPELCLGALAGLLLALAGGRGALDDRATLAAWTAPVVVLLGLVGLSPGGLPPSPLSYWLFAACGRLALVALVLALGRSISRANRSPHGLDEAGRVTTS